MRNFLLMVFCALLIAGCSSSAKNPTTPSNNNLDGAPVIGLSEAGDSFNAIGILGVYDLTVNPDTMEVNLVPKRMNTAVGDSYLINGAAYFLIAPCVDCLKVMGYSLSPTGGLLISFTARHPFAPGDPALPPTGKNRNDLDLFDVAACVVPQQGAATPTTFTKTGVSAYVGICANADGYTRELMNVTTDPAAVPYFLAIDDSSTGVGTFNKLAQGASTNFNIELDLSGGVIPAFDIYLTFGYGSSTKKQQRLTPKYYNPEFNRKSAWYVTATPPVGGWLNNDSTTPKTVEVKVWDWQQGSVVSTTVPYSDETDTTKVAFESKVASVSVEIPGMTSALPSSTTAASGTGAPADPLVYQIPIANELLLPAGKYLSFVKVLDSRIPPTTATTGTVDALIHNPGAPNPTEWKVIPEFATYQAFVAEVKLGCGPIIGEIMVPRLANFETVTGYADGQRLNVTVHATSTGSTISLYEADYAYDGTTFTPDASNATGIFTNLGPIAVPAPCDANVPYNFTIAFRATDTCVPPNVTIFKIMHGTANYCKANPVGDVTITINRSATANSYGLPFDANGPWTVKWTAVPGAAEYAIYVDTDPGNYALPAWTIASLTDSLSLVGTTTGVQFTCPYIPLVSANKYTPGNTYVVRARSAIGVLETESTNSQLAFIMTFGYNTAPANSITPEGWVSCSSYSSTGTWYYWMNAYNYQAMDSQCYEWGFYTSAYSASVPLAGATKLTPPGIPTSKRYMDTSIYLYQFGQPGIFFVTSATQPTSSLVDLSMMEWVGAYSTGSYQAYNAAYQANLQAVGLGDVGSGNDCWNVTSPNKKWVATCIDDNSGDTTDKYVGIMKVENLGSSYPYPSIDDTAIMIY